jgi:hypothetical protein
MYVSPQQQHTPLHQAESPWSEIFFGPELWIHKGVLFFSRSNRLFFYIDASSAQGCEFQFWFASSTRDLVTQRTVPVTASTEYTQRITSPGLAFIHNLD